MSSRYAVALTVELLARAYPERSRRDIEIDVLWTPPNDLIGLNSLHGEERHALRARMSEAQNHRCCYCRSPMDERDPNPWNCPTFEHIIPRSRGGDDTPGNLAIACKSCNHNRSSARLVTEIELMALREIMGFRALHPPDESDHLLPIDPEILRLAWRPVVTCAD